MYEVKAKREERARLITQMDAIAEKANSEKREMTTEENTEWDRINGEVDAMYNTIQRMERQNELNKQNSETTEVKTEEKPELRQYSEDEKRELFTSGFRATWFNRKLTQDEENVFGSMRVAEDVNIADIPGLEGRQQSTTTTAGGFTIPEGFSNELEVAMAEWGGMREISRIYKTATGNPVPWPSTNDTDKVAYLIAESGNLTTNAEDAVFAQAFTLQAYKYTSGLVQITNEIIQDSAFDFMQVMKDLFARRMGAGLNAAYTTADGSAKPQGVFTGATNSGISGVAAAGITRDNLVDLKHSVDPAYRRTARFMFNDTTLKLIKKLTVGTSDDRPLWQAGIAVGEPDTIDGSPYTINQDVADVGASAKSVMYGDFSKFIIREVQGDRIVILNERFAELDQKGLVMLARRDSHVLDAGTNPLKYITHPAT
jgi:HK97 family phage major capsid protein